jgi:zinc protease
MMRFAIAASALSLVAACASHSPTHVAPLVVAPGTPPPVATTSAAAKRMTPDAPFRAGPPPEASAAPFVPPEPVTVWLRNGIPLTFVHQTSGVLSIAVAAAGGAVDVGAAKVETVDLMLATMMAASKTRASDAVRDELARLVMPSFASDYYSDGVVVSAKMVAPAVKAGVALFADVVLHPAFQERDFAWYANVLASERDASAADPATVGERTLRRVLFGQHPYSAIRGSGADVRAVKRADVATLHARMFDASRLAIVAAGDVNEKDVFAAIDASFGGVPRHDQPPRAPATPTASTGPRIFVVNRPSASVTRVHAGVVGPAADAADGDAAQVALELLADGTLGRITAKLRRDMHAAWVRRESYTLRAARYLGWQSMVPNDEVAASLVEIQRQMKMLAVDGPTQDELTIVHDGYASYLGALLGTPAQTASTYAYASLMGLSVEAVKQGTTRRATLNAAAIGSAAARWLDPTRVRVVLVGDWEAVRESVTALGWGVSLKDENGGARN